VVVAISALIIGMLVPSFKRSLSLASATVCQHNLREIGHALDLYRIENGGWLPTSSSTTPGSQSAAGSRDYWFLRLFPSYLPDPTLLMCPEDPFRSLFLQGRNENDRTIIPDYASYGLNGFIMNARGGYLANLGRYPPPRPLQTILLADQGPDSTSGRRHAEITTRRFRNVGRLPIDDGYDPFCTQPPEPWLTVRHGYGVNMLTADGHNVTEVSTVEAIRSPNQRFYWDCASAGCTLCVVGTPHYSFHRSRLYWWTGPLPGD
jgi:type II secretory pathway pseudopilin PulG